MYLVGEGRARPKKRILVVDDKECIRTSMSLVLTEMGYQVRSVDDGLAALRAIRKDTPEILLSDLNMPGLSQDLNCCRWSGSGFRQFL